MVALTEVTASLGAILAATIPLWVVLLSRLIGTPVPLASRVRLAAGFGGIAVVVLTAPDSAISGAPWGAPRLRSESRASAETSPARERRPLSIDSSSLASRRK